ncbi:MAG: FAD-dependent oxidoreductase, partial [Acidimicrobiales bacterium]
VELPDPGAIEVETRRLASVYPVYELATEGSRRLVRSWLRDQRRVVGVGRQGLGVPDNLHHVLAMGRAAADALDGGGRLIADRWRASLDTFALHVVED